MLKENPGSVFLEHFSPKLPGEKWTVLWSSLPTTNGYVASYQEWFGMLYKNMYHK
jgi:hypothetical protein